MSDIETVSTSSSPNRCVATKTNCPTDVSLDVSVKIERIESDHEDSSEAETLALSYVVDPNVMTWINDQSTLCHRSLQVKLTRLPTFLLKLFIKEPNENNCFYEAAEETPLQTEESDKTGLEELSDPELVSIVFDSKFRLAQSRLLASATQQKPINKAGTVSNNGLNCKTNGTPDALHIAADKDVPKSFINANNNVPQTKIKPNTEYYTKDICSTKEFKCTMCKYKTNREKVLKTHLQAHSAAKQYVCDTCSYIATRRFIFEHHMKMHKGEKPYDCDVCKRKFTLLSDLYRHIRTHSSEKPYSCEICYKKFSQLRYLKVHASLHTGKKPYACEMCDRKFAQSCNLNLHMRIHTGYKPYACKICDKKFNRKGILNNHIRTHTNEKPFVCKLCGREYSDRGNFTKHVQAHSKGPIRCYRKKSFKAEHIEGPFKSINKRLKREVEECD